MAMSRVNDKHDDMRLARELLILSWGRLRAREEFKKLTLAECNDLTEYNKRYKKLRDMLSVIDSRLEWIEQQLQVMEEETQVNDYLI